MLIIAGPCSIESREITLEVANKLKGVNLPQKTHHIIFKASFDKANRSSIDSWRGVGLKKGMDILREVKDSTGLQITTDIHEPWQAAKVAKVVDIIQIPAFLCRQTDLLLAAAQTGKTVTVKKGQFLSPESMGEVVMKLKAGGCEDMYLMERGTFFGYGRLVNDMTSLLIMKDLGVPVIFDATHSVQRPSSEGNSTGGNREYVEPLAKAATAIGVDGLFFEVHPNPNKALSDGANTIILDDFEKMIDRVLRYDLCIRPCDVV
jgi:2-dehydro-3-deoxyphosphooctonate aldolase (KDO 8-P synthase)